jgi:hypothetical protein
MPVHNANERLTRPARRAVQILQCVLQSTNPLYSYDVREVTNATATKTELKYYLAMPAYHGCTLVGNFLHKAGQPKIKLIFSRWRIGYRRRFEHRANTWLQLICTIFVNNSIPQFIKEYNANERSISPRGTVENCARNKAEAQLYETLPCIAKMISN